MKFCEEKKLINPKWIKHKMKKFQLVLVCFLKQTIMFKLIIVFLLIIIFFLLRFYKNGFSILVLVFWLFLLTIIPPACFFVGMVTGLWVRVILQTRDLVFTPTTSIHLSRPENCVSPGLKVLQVHSKACECFLTREGLFGLNLEEKKRIESTLE